MFAGTITRPMGIHPKVREYIYIHTSRYNYGNGYLHKTSEEKGLVCMFYGTNIYRNGKHEL